MGKTECFFVGYQLGNRKDKVTKQFLVDENNNPLFWYRLDFAIPVNNNKNWESGTVFVSKEVFEKFTSLYSPMCYIDACVVKARGSFILVKF